MCSLVPPKPRGWPPAARRVPAPDHPAPGPYLAGVPVAPRAGRWPEAQAAGRRVLRIPGGAHPAAPAQAGAPKACPPPGGRARQDFVIPPKSCGSLPCPLHPTTPGNPRGAVNRTLRRPSGRTPGAQATGVVPTVRAPLPIPTRSRPNHG
jgi:hypothetical protein